MARDYRVLVEEAGGKWGNTGKTVGAQRETTRGICGNMLGGTREVHAPKSEAKACMQYVATVGGARTLWRTREDAYSYLPVPRRHAIPRPYG